ncbi:GH39 family glycosyl hydrolase [Anaerocolumna sp. MB42-C2]|uniref:GH39 family glycosyl hydrolase n=1 Tax=Anaerocolumna sp. MB42-C2 TaxID=3070997 RepID=UPI0027DF9ECD|nr:helix-turn-helix domain-containing protein [Anaerocolumna sp. MB42-C2]WMJ85432.1 helix-turn-helix domain-containing protein [Anaerocolumna sp. MB42-C2]
MNSNHEIIEYSKNLPIKLFCQRIGSVSKHWHRSIELLLVLSGDLDVWIETERFTLKENDLILINSNQVHETYSKDCVLIALQVRLSMFHMDWLNTENVFFHCNSSLQINNKHFDYIREIIAKLIELNTSTVSYNQLLSYSYACRLIYELLIHYKAEQPAVVRTQKQMERLGKLIEYIEKNYNREITLHELAELEYLSPSYLSHFFEKNMNISITNYLTKIRIEHSLDYLLNTDYSIEKIAELCGFSSPRSYASFFRKQYNELPSQFRKEKKYDSIPLDHLDSAQNSSYLNLDKYDFFGKLSAYLNKNNFKNKMENERHKVNLGSINTRATTPFTNPALTFCSVGRAKEILYRNIQDMLITQQKEIGFRYIKFHGIFDDALMVYREDSAGCPVLNFNMIDEILDFLLSIHLSPLIQYSFMPKALAETPEKEFFAIPFIMSEPKDYTKWEYLVTQFTKHILKRYGFSEISGWIFTFWNETLSNFPFDFKSREISLQLYEITRNAVKKVNPQLQFANTSYVNSNLSTDTMQYALKYMEDNNCIPDIYLFHFYPTSGSPRNKLKEFDNDKFMEYMSNCSLSLSNDPDAFGTYLDMLNNNLPGRSNKPLYITEWNLSPSHRELLNDTCYASAYFIRNILKNYTKADSFCHWCLSDWMEELSFPADLFHGGVGHFTKNGIKKPAYYSYLFLSKLKESLIEQGEGYFITKTKNIDDFSIILYNYCHFSDLYSKGLNFNFSYTSRYEVFPDDSKKELIFTLSGLGDGEYTLTEEIVNRNYGSCYDKWLEMGAVPLETEEVETLKQLSHPLLKKTICSVTNQALDYKAVLEPFEIRLIRITKKE